MWGTYVQWRNCTQIDCRRIRIHIQNVGRSKVNIYFRRLFAMQLQTHRSQFNLTYYRKQERKIRGMLVDYRKRAERRQDFYEKIVMYQCNKFNSRLQDSSTRITCLFVLSCRKLIQRNSCKFMAASVKSTLIQPLLQPVKVLPSCKWYSLMWKAIIGSPNINIRKYCSPWICMAFH